MPDAEALLSAPAPPRVSVTVISYNQEAWLSAALDSALAQDWPDLEIVVSDDGSTDASREILADYAARRPERIRPLFNGDNQGLAGNRDRAIAACTGEFIAWLDADDLWSPDKVSRQVAFMQADPDCALSYHDLQVWRDATPTEERYYQGPRRGLDGDHRTLLEAENFVASSAVMFRAADLPRLGYHFPQGPTFNDYHFFYRMGRLGRIRYIDAVLGGYRRHGESATHTIREVRSGVRQRRERALKSILQESPAERDAVRYALSRFYLSQLSGAVRARDAGVGTHAALELAGLWPHSARAWADRRAGRNTLSTFD